MDRLLLVDGHNLLFQMFYGMPARILSADGRPMQAVLGFVGALNKMMGMLEPSHVLVLFDREQPNQRSQLLPEYKANRPDYGALPDEDNPFAQLPDLYRALDHMGIRHAEVADFEADDGIAACCLRWGRDMEIFVSSFDSDLFQLITDQVRILRYRGRASAIWDCALFAQRFGIPPEYYADFKALVGDHSDNIRGITGIGPKTAARLIGQLGGLDDLFAHLELVENRRIREKLREDQALALRNRELIRLDGRAPLPFSPEQLRHSPRREKTMEILRQIGLI